MRISIQGKQDKVTKQEVREAIKFFASQLMTRELIKHLDIKVLFLELWKKHRMKGEASIIEIEGEYPREFTLKIDCEQPRDKILKTLAHEMVHVKQFATGELNSQICPDKKTFWQGLIYDDDDQNPSYEIYWTRPWEIEAYGREVGLYKLYLIHKRKRKK